jgi:hypothetical protein
MNKVLVLICLVLFGCTPSIPKELSAAPPVNTVSKALLDAMDRTQETLGDNKLSKNQKICELALTILINSAIDDYLMSNLDDPIRSSLNYELKKIKEFYKDCKKKYK